MADNAAARLNVHALLTMASTSAYVLISTGCRYNAKLLINYVYTQTSYQFCRATLYLAVVVTPTSAVISSSCC